MRASQCTEEYSRNKRIASFIGHSKTPRKRGQARNHKKAGQDGGCHVGRAEEVLLTEAGSLLISLLEWGWKEVSGCVCF